MAKQSTIRSFIYKNLSDFADIFKSEKAAPSTLSTGSAPFVSGKSLGRGVSMNTFYELYRSHGDIYAAVKEISENVGSAGYELVNTKSPEKEASQVEAKLFDEIIGSRVSFRRFKAELIQTVSIAGSAYVHLVRGGETGKVIGIEFLDPRCVSAVTDKKGNMLRWVYRIQNSTINIKPEDVAHFYLQKDPASWVFGLSPLEPIVWDVMTDQRAAESNLAFFENSALPAAHFILDEDLSEEQVKRALELAQKELKGAKNQHKSAVLSGVKEIKTLSISQRDMEYHALRRFTTEKICSVYGVPKSILNYTDGVNLANGQEQTKKFWEGTIQPLEEAVAEFINKRLLPKIGITEIAIEFNPKEFDTREWIEASSREDLRAGVLTLNELREMRGYEKSSDPMADQHILHNGAGAVLLEDVGVDPFDAGLTNPDNAQKEIDKIREAAARLTYEE